MFPFGGGGPTPPWVGGGDPWGLKKKPGVFQYLFNFFSQRLKSSLLVSFSLSPAWQLARPLGFEKTPVGNAFYTHQYVYNSTQTSSHCIFLLSICLLSCCDLLNGGMMNLRGREG